MQQPVGWLIVGWVRPQAVTQHFWKHSGGVLLNKFQIERNIKVDGRIENNKEESYLSAVTCGIAFLFFMALSLWKEFPQAVGVYGFLFCCALSVVIQINFIFGKITKHKYIFQVTISSFLIVLCIFGYGEANTLLNSIFGVDATAFPNTKIILSSLYVFKYIFFPIIIILGLIFFYNLFFSSKEEYAKCADAVSTFIVILFLTFTYCYHLNEQKKLEERAYVLAQLLDFNDLNKDKACNLIIAQPKELLEKDRISEIQQNKKIIRSPRVIYFTPDYSSVLVDWNLEEQDIKNLSVFTPLEIKRDWIRKYPCN